MLSVALAAGSITAITINGVEQLLANHSSNQLTVDHYLISNSPNHPVEPPPPVEIPVTPLDEIGPGETSVGPAAPDGALPADLTPTPGSNPVPGSARPRIEIKPKWSFLDLIPGLKKPEGVSLQLVKTKDIIKQTKDPIWQLQLVDNKGTVLDRLPALTGRANRQALDRHQSGNKSPLPAGTYRIDRLGIERGPFGDPELGRGFWVPITPLFSTGRSALGFHQDPSWGKLNGESGTSGCIGLENSGATIQLVEWIKHFNIKTLTVKS